MSESSQESGEGIRLITQTLITVLLVVVYVTTGPLLRRFKVKIIHESGVTMIIAIILTLLALLINPHSDFLEGFQFDETFFFTFVLPLIIFSAGYTLRRDLFFKNFRYIAVFSITGTFITFFIIAILTYFANKHQFFYFTMYSNDNSTDIINTTIVSNISNITDNLSSNISNITNATNINNTDVIEPLSISIPIEFTLWEILLFSAAISASDTISLSTFLDEDSDQKLLSISSGEGLINNAFCIALVRIIYRENQKADTQFTVDIAWEMVERSILLFIFSFILGTIIGCLCSLFLKKLKYFHLNRVQEISILLLFAFISYILGDWLNLSPIISILSCGIFLSHYTFYNLSFQSREESYSVAKVLEVLASAFAFSFLGLTTVYFTTQAFSIGFIVFELIAIFIARFVSIFIQIYILQLFWEEDFKLKSSKKLMLTFSGTIRGAVSFALAISIQTPNDKNREVLISSAVFIVFITTVVIGGFMQYIFKLIKNLSGIDDIRNGLRPSLPTEEELFTFLHPNFQISISKKKEKPLNELRTQVSYWLGHYWVEFDDVCIKPKLVFGWPGVKEDNDTLTKMIKIALHKYSARKGGMTVETDNMLTPEQNQKIEMNFMGMSEQESQLRLQGEESGFKMLSEKIISQKDSDKKTSKKGSNK